MAQLKQQLSINVLGIDTVKNLIEAIEKHYKDMPQELKDIIREADETGIRDYTIQDLERYLMLNNLSLNDIYLSHQEVVTANKYLRKLYYVDGNVEYVDSFTIKYKDTLIYGW